jgi:hypothetical protein
MFIGLGSPDKSRTHLSPWKLKYCTKAETNHVGYL